MSVWPCWAFGKGVLLGRVGGIKSAGLGGSRGGLDGPGVTGVEAVAMMAASATDEAQLYRRERHGLRIIT